MAEADCATHNGTMTDAAAGACRQFYTDLATQKAEEEAQYCADLLDKNDHWLCEYNCGVETNSLGIRQFECSTCDAKAAFIVFIGFVVACIVFVVVRMCCYNSKRKDRTEERERAPSSIEYGPGFMVQGGQLTVSQEYELQVAIGECAANAVSHIQI